MIKLSEISPKAPKHFVKEEIKEQTKDLFQKIGDLQNLIYAEKKHSVPFILLLSKTYCL